MILFSISCETCASRLNVRQQAAIGQVLACPKCGSMVEVQPPEGWTPPVDPDAPPRVPKPPADPNDSQATVDSELADLRTQLDRPKNDVAAPRHVRSKAVPREQRAVADTKAEKPAAPPVQDSPIMPDGNWTSDTARQRRKALGWMAGVLGLCLVGLVLGLYTVSKMMGSNDEEPITSQVAQNDNEQGDDKKRVANPTADKGDASKKDSKGETDKKKSGKSAEKGISDKKASRKASDKLNADSKTNTKAKATDEGNPDAVKQPKDTSPMNPPNDTSPELPDDGLDVDGALTPEKPKSLTDDREKSILDQLDGLDELMNPGINAEGFRQATTDSQSSLIGIGKVYVPRPKKLEFDFVLAVNEPYPGLMYSDVPLIELLRSLTTLTQVPFQLDLQAVELGVIDPFAKVSGKIEDGSAVELLSKAIDPLNLKWTWDEARNAIVVGAVSGGELRKIDVELQHLKPSDESKKAAVVAAIQRIIQPDSWNTNGGVGTLQFDANKITFEQAGILADSTKVLLEKMDAATGLISNPNDEQLLGQLASNYSRSADLRNGTGTYYSAQNEPLRLVLKKLQQDDGMVLLMDWVELMQYDWNPRVEIPWKSKELTLAKTLNDLTSSMNLAYRILDEDVIEITSKRKLDLATRLEVFPCNKQVAKGYDEKRILGLLQSGLAADLPPTELAYTWVEYVEECQCVVAVLPDPLLIRTEKILQQMLETE